MPFPLPSVTPPTLEPWEMSFNGLTFGGIDLAKNLRLIQATGLDMASVRAGDADRPRDQGEFIGLDLLSGRDVIVDLQVKTDATSLAHAKQALEVAVAPQTVTEVPFWMQFPGAPLKVCMARTRKWNFPWDQALIAPGVSGAATDKGWIVTSLAFHATDPRLYTTPTTQTAVSPGGSHALDNLGSFEMRPLLIVNGPANAPTIENTSIAGNPTLQFVNPTGGGSDVLAGDTLTIDLDLHSVLYYNHISGLTTSVPNWIAPASTWWNLLPGNNVIHYTTSSGSGALDINWASAYLSA